MKLVLRISDGSKKADSHENERMTFEPARKKNKSLSDITTLRLIAFIRNSVFPNKYNFFKDL